MILAPISHVFRWNTNHRFIEKATVLDKLIEIFSTDRANSTDRSTIGKGWAASLVTFRHDSYESIARIVYTYRCRVVELELHSYAGSNGNLVGHRWEEAGGWNEGMNDRDGVRGGIGSSTWSNRTGEMDQTESVRCRGNLFEENSTISANHDVEASTGTTVFWTENLSFILRFVYEKIDWLRKI